MTRCSVEGCTREAEPDHGFQQIADVHGVRIKTTGLLCEEHWQLMMDGQKEPKTYKIRYCVECRKAQGRLAERLECPICKGVLCADCLIQHEQRAHPLKKEEPKETYPCTHCAKKLTEPILFMGKPYCADCWIALELWRHSGFTSDPAKDPFYTSWNTQQQHTNSRARTGCSECGNIPEQVCTHCNKPMCGRCYAKHLKEKAFQKYENCQKPSEQLTLCSTCQKNLCATCLESHRVYEEIFGTSGNPYQTRREYGKSPFEDIKFEYTKVNEDEAKHNNERFERFWTRYTGMGNNPFWGEFTRESTSGTGPKTNQQSQQARTSYLPRETAEAFKMLEITPTQDAAAIKKAYHALALKYHPDKPTGDAEKMKQINKANDLVMKYAGKK